MRYSSLFVFMFLAGSAFAQPTNLSSTAQKELEQLDAQQQHRQQTLLEQKDAQFSAQSNVQFTKPPTSSLSLPEQEQPCFQVNKIFVVDYQTEHIPLSQQSSQSTFFSSSDFSYRLSQSTQVFQADRSDFYWAYQQAARELKLTLPRCLGSEGINVLMKKMQNLMIDKGYVTTRVVAGEQDLTSGQFILTVIPGRLRYTFIEDKSRVNKFTRLTAWTAMVPQQGDVLNARDIEQSLENFKRVATADATINIVPAEGEAQLGESDLAVQYAQAFPFRLTLGLDDAGSTSTGRWQGSVTLSVDNIFTANDLFYTSFTHSLKRPHWAGEDDKGHRQSRNLSFYYSVPWRYWQLSASHAENDYVQEVAAAFGSTVMYSGKSEQSKLTLSRLVFRNAQHKTTLSGSLWARKSHNFINDEEVTIQRKRTGGWELGLQHKAYIGNASVELGANFKRGTGLNHAIPYPDEQFNEETSRMKIISANLDVVKPFTLSHQQFLFNTSWRGQWNKTPLVAQDRLSIGGRYTVRGTDGELSLAAERGWVWRNELGWWLGNSGQQLYFSLDKGKVSGPSSQDLLGTTLVGSSLGLKGGWKWLSYDVFVGKPWHVPEGFRTSKNVVGFHLSASF
ncbi:TPA: ShlB/FhaC/HecB family hemolysin secretion/activation protein [Pasteurella multocida]|uniref:ShlB/FhaC/HecB family hemolysin secretion/activation protein n=1 Tax=Pasteurella multocida TaxID=747 RepID=UPI0028DFA00D|nr:ShlB/FhaC/HecB family hemolysin secretion/activation protein [Pasteurella multocida]MDY0499926.1 ShlB/FhaC/HecB family hemolysin secretion/activation protein [Pasteurella multocida]WRU40891.1 ShlB/FhaC/HecB family hemolysin secretion/activation protein [Pasteurella multocida]HDR1920131.1 ShlB/FhaC/HecB family hemolysin secretion/activation protein [Pasteurella multocida]HEA3245888.1 ShlB/FhaC/HecB family hemolysin secretion/activation protein [Pasteurella multocida]HED4430484.1 ShlB/FhaC/He